jgi:hypothetical protein
MPNLTEFQKHLIRQRLGEGIISYEQLLTLAKILFSSPFIIWFYGSAIVIIRGWGCGFGNNEHIVTWSENRPSFTVLGFMAVVAYCRGI